MLLFMLNFPCTACGECCRHISHIEELKGFDRGDGRCKYLNGNTCSIYETRPLICRVDEMFEVFYKQQMTEGEFINLNLRACKELQVSNNVPVTQQVILPKKQERGAAFEQKVLG